MKLKAWSVPGLLGTAGDRTQYLMNKQKQNEKRDWPKERHVLCNMAREPNRMDSVPKSTAQTVQTMSCSVVIAMAADL